MHFSEDELRDALRRKDPGESFTKDVITRIALRQAQGAITASLSDRFRKLWRELRLRPALASALVAILVFAGGLLGLVQYRRVREQRAGEAAKQQALLALRITNAKLNHVFERVKTAPSP